MRILSRWASFFFARLHFFLFAVSGVFEVVIVDWYVRVPYPDVRTLVCGFDIFKDEITQKSFRIFIWRNALIEAQLTIMKFKGLLLKFRVFV